MNHSPLEKKLQTLRQATTPEEIFGANTPATELKKQFRQWATQTHPDYHPQTADKAHEAFQLLQRWYEQAEAKQKRGVYGKQRQLELRSKTRLYEGWKRPLTGDFCDIYPVVSSDDEFVLKLVRNGRNNDLMQAEARALKKLNRTLRNDPLQAHFPTFVERFLVRDEAGMKRQANILQPETDFVTLADVVKAYPNGINPADMAWMFNRVLAILGIIHSQGLVHGAVVPQHIFIWPHNHNGMLTDWCYSVAAGEPIKAIVSAAKAFYPAEVLEKRPSSPATDIYMAALCMVQLLGGDVARKTIPTVVPKPIRALLKSCLIGAPHRRANNAWELFDSFHNILGHLYGAPQFRPFSMSG